MRKSFISCLSTFALSALGDVWPVWLAVSLLTTIPYIIAALRTPTGHEFSGVLTAYDDTFAYFAWMREGADFRLLMCDPFTSEMQPCEFFLPLWNLLGLGARVGGVPIALMYNAARLLSGLLLLVVARAVAGSVMKSRTRLRYTLWLYAMSGGLGWLVFVLKNGGNLFCAAAADGSADLDLPEAIAFRSIFSQVHFAAGAALVCGAIKLFFDAIIEKNAARALISGILVSLLAVVHPYMVIVVWGVSGVALMLLPWLSDRTAKPHANCGSNSRAAVAFILGTIPGIAYLTYLNRSNEVLREWLRITDTFSPPPWEYVLGFGIVAILAVVGFRLLWDRRITYGRLLLVWVLVQAALLYAPVSFQRRFVEGLQLPLLVAASVALFWISRRVFKRINPARYRKFLFAAILVFASITNIGFIIGQMIGLGPGSGSTDRRRYLPSDLVSALDWLRTNSNSGTALFSSYLTGNVAPSITGSPVFLGHYAQTLHSDEKGAQVTGFYTNAMSDGAARKLFADYRVGYIIYGPFERSISPRFVPPSWLKLLYSEGDVEIFEVTDGSE